jgi:hypothetical protein
MDRRMMEEDEWMAYSDCTTNLERAKWLVVNGQECRDGNWEEHLMHFVNEDGLDDLFAVVTAAVEIRDTRRGHHGDMYGCVTCYHARKTEDRCAEGRLISAINVLVPSA